MRVSEEKVSAYIEKLEAIEKRKEEIKDALFYSMKIEAHLEMLCLLGFMDVLERKK